MKRTLFILILTSLLISCKSPIEQIIEAIYARESAQAEEVEEVEVTPIKLREGTEKNYDENGKLKSIITYKEGVRNGVAKYYYPNGNLKTKCIYKDNKKNGPAKDYYQNGKTHFSCYYVDNEKHGFFKWYYEEGPLYQLSKFVYGEKDSIETTYYENGKVRSKSNWHKGMPGIGLIEYRKNGSKYDMPEIVVKKIDNRAKGGPVVLEISLDDGSRNVDFYMEGLSDDKYLPDYYQAIPNNGGTGILEYDVSVGVKMYQKLTLVAKKKTRLRNAYITQKEYELVLK